MAEWKKLIVSGSDAELNSLVVTDGITVGDNIISSSAAGTVLSGSFSGSFFGNITADLGLTGTDGGTGIVDLESENLVFATGSADAMDITISDNTATFTLNDATTTTKGISSFSNSYFNVSSGAVSISASAITETELNTSVAGTGLSGGGGSALSVVYGATSASAVQGTTNFTLSGTTNEIEITGTTSQPLGSGPSYTVGLPNNVTITNDLNVGNDVVITGDLTVNGTTTTIDTTNLVVEDKFILLASGSTSATDGGIVIQAASDGTGRALFYDSTETRWSLRNSLSGTATTATPEANIAAVVDVAGASHSDTATYQKNGNIKIEGTDIYIWAP